MSLIPRARKETSRRIAIALGCVLGLTAAAAHASDGRLEISDACAATGCFAGDVPGLPVSITQPGSYVLTSNLTASSTGAITTSALGVDLDLNGFSVIGPGSCTASLGGDGKLVAVTCTGTSGTGISGVASIRNGTVRGFATGIIPPASTPMRVERMTVRETSGAGIAGEGRRLIVLDSVFSTNADEGISGQSIQSGFTVRGCVFERNAQGLYLANGVVSESVFVENTEAVRSNAGGSGLVVNNSFHRNVTALGGADLRYRSNVFEETTNALGGTNLGSNTCNGAVCP